MPKPSNSLNLFYARYGKVNYWGKSVGLTAKEYFQSMLNSLILEYQESGSSFLLDHLKRHREVIDFVTMGALLDAKFAFDHEGTRRPMDPDYTINPVNINGSREGFEWSQNLSFTPLYRSDDISDLLNEIDKSGRVWYESQHRPAPVPSGQEIPITSISDSTAPLAPAEKASPQEPADITRKAADPARVLTDTQHEPIPVQQAEPVRSPAPDEPICPDSVPAAAQNSEDSCPDSEPLYRQLAELREKNEQLSEKVGRLTANYHDKEQENQQLRDKLAALQPAYQQNQLELQNTKAALQQVQTQLNQAQAALDHMTEDLTDSQGRMKAMDDQRRVEMKRYLDQELHAIRADYDAKLQEQRANAPHLPDLDETHNRMADFSSNLQANIHTELEQAQQRLAQAQQEMYLYFKSWQESLYPREIEGLAETYVRLYKIRDKALSLWESFQVLRTDLPADGYPVSELDKFLRNLSNLRTSMDALLRKYERSMSEGLDLYVFTPSEGQLYDSISHQLPDDEDEDDVMNLDGQPILRCLVPGVARNSSGDYEPYVLCKAVVQLKR